MFDITASYALWFVSWDVARDCRWPPFPFRTDTKIIYPYRGSGWYHHDEVCAALETFGDAITVHHGIVMEPQCDHIPFAFVPELYDYRAQLKRARNQAQLSLKLGLNSLYGKTAQGIGKGDRRPPYQSYLWAGMITSGTRAMLTNAIRHHHDDIIEIATDSICSKVPLSLPVSEQLGAWEYNAYDESFSVQPGIYDLVKDGEHKTRSRGFGKSEANWEEIKRAYLEDPLLGIYKYNVVRFMGLGGALQSNQFSNMFRRWIEHVRTINFCPAKRIPLPFARGISPQLYTTDQTYRALVLADFDGSVTLLPPDAPAFQPVSRPYQPRQSWVDSWSLWHADPETALDLEQP